MDRSLAESMAESVGHRRLRIVGTASGSTRSSSRLRIAARDRTSGNSGAGARPMEPSDFDGGHWLVGFICGGGHRHHRFRSSLREFLDSDRWSSIGTDGTLSRPPILLLETSVLLHPADRSQATPLLHRPSSGTSHPWYGHPIAVPECQVESNTCIPLPRLFPKILSPHYPKGPSLSQ